jgi:hypothetical protein
MVKPKPLLLSACFIAAMSVGAEPQQDAPSKDSRATASQQITDFWMVGLTLGLVIVGGTQALIMKGQAVIMKRQTEIINESLRETRSTTELARKSLELSQEQHVLASRIELVHQLIERMADINKYCKDTGINPYDVDHTRSGKAFLDYEKKGTALLLHLGLLYLVYMNRITLGAQVESTYLHWFNTVVFPWIKVDPEIKSNWDESKSHGDVFGEAFFKWLQ